MHTCVYWAKNRWLNNVYCNAINVVCCVDSFQIQIEVELGLSNVGPSAESKKLFLSDEGPTFATLYFTIRVIL